MARTEAADNSREVRQKPSGHEAAAREAHGQNAPRASTNEVFNARASDLSWLDTNEADLHMLLLNGSKKFEILNAAFSCACCGCHFFS